MARRLAVEHAAEIVAAYRNGWQAGDWRAADAFLTRVFGRPTERLEGELNVNRPLSEWDAGELDAFLAQVLREGGEGAAPGMEQSL